METMLGNLEILAWTSSQCVVALASGEAVYLGRAKGASQGLAISSMLKGFGVDVKIMIRTGASVAKGMECRQGLGKVRRIEVNRVWMQDRVARADIEIKKAHEEEDAAYIQNLAQRKIFVFPRTRRIRCCEAAGTSLRRSEDIYRFAPAVRTDTHSCHVVAWRHSLVPVLLCVCRELAARCAIWYRIAIRCHMRDEIFFVSNPRCFSRSAVGLSSNSKFSSVIAPQSSRHVDMRAGIWRL